jgi:hypothetical protein
LPSTPQWLPDARGEDDAGAVVFSFRESRVHGELTSLLGGFRGVLQSDQYGAYASH